jgi:hypothetical protein
VSRRSLLIGTAVGLTLYGLAMPALLALGLLERLSGSWTLHTMLLAITVAAALAGAGPRTRTSLGGALVGAGLAVFAWLEIDFHLLRIAETTSGLGDIAFHAAGTAIAAVGYALAGRRTAGPSNCARAKATSS